MAVQFLGQGGATLQKRGHSLRPAWGAKLPDGLGCQWVDGKPTGAIVGVGIRIFGAVEHNVRRHRQHQVFAANVVVGARGNVFAPMRIHVRNDLARLQLVRIKVIFGFPPRHAWSQTGHRQEHLGHFLFAPGGQTRHRNAQCGQDFQSF